MSRSDRGEYFAPSLSANTHGLCPEYSPRPFGAPPSRRGANHRGFIGKREISTTPKTDRIRQHAKGGQLRYRKISTVPSEFSFAELYVAKPALPWIMS